MSTPAGGPPPPPTPGSVPPRPTYFKFRQYFRQIPANCPIEEFSRYFNRADSQIYRNSGQKVSLSSRENGVTAKLAVHLWETRNNNQNPPTTQASSSASTAQPTPPSTTTIKMDDDKAKKQPVIKKGTAKAVMKGGKKNVGKRSAAKSGKHDLDKNKSGNDHDHDHVLHTVKKDVVKTAVSKKLTKKEVATKKILAKKTSGKKDVIMKDAPNDHGHDSDDGDDSDSSDDGDSDASDDNKVYCDCNGPDDHSVMISCDGCQQWFHAKCYNIREDDAEILLLLFHCKTCKEKNPALKTRFKNLCRYNNLHDQFGLPECRQPVRRVVDGFPFDSPYCCREHSRAYMKYWYNTLPDTAEPSRGGVISKREFCAMIQYAGGSVEKFKSIGKIRPTIEIPDDFNYKTILTEEESDALDSIVRERALIMAREHIVDEKLELLSFIIKKAKGMILGNRGEKVCGYSKLLAVNDAEFREWRKTDEAIKIFQDQEILDDSSFCVVKNCRKHRDWAVIENEQHALDSKQMEEDMAAFEAEENAIKEWSKSREAMAKYKK